MTALGDVLELQLVLFLVMGAGLVLTKLGVITASGRKCLTDLLIDLILPCNILCSFQIEMSREILLATLWVLGIACGIQAACYLLGKWIFCFAPEAQKKVLQYATMCSNAGFMGNPIIEGLYGAQGLLYGSVYLIPLRFFMWSAGLSCFTKSTPGETVKKLATHPCILAVFLGFALLLTQWQMPAFLDRTAYYCAVRLLLVPLLTLAACRLLGLDALVTGVCVVLSGMPAGSTTAILAEKYGGDAEYASKCIFLSTLLSLATIPLLCGLMAAL